MKRNILATAITILGLAALIVKQVAASEFQRYYAFILPYIVSNAAVLVMLIISLKTKVREVNTENLTFCVCLVAANLPIFMGLSGISLASPEPNPTVKTFASVMSMLAISFYIPAVINLGSKISIIPVATSLETSGIYSFSRHPLYSCYIYWDVMQVFILQSWTIAVVSAIQISFQIYRAKAEERILEKNFPEYGEYKKRVWWLGRNPLYKKG